MRYKAIPVLVSAVVLYLVAITTVCNGDLLENVLFLLFNNKNITETYNEFLKRSKFPHHNVHIVLYPRNQPKDQLEVVTSKNFSSNYDTQKCTKFIVPGWMSSYDTGWLLEMMKTFHEETPCNVLSVNWTEYSSLNYLDAASAVESVGIVLGNFLKNVSDVDDKFLGNTHLIGHSLGAHVVGRASSVLQKYQKIVNRTTGLDPAAPLFEYPVRVNKNLRINSHYSAYVDVYHSSILGVNGRYGDVDVYINGGGPVQKTCASINLLDAVVCSHGYASRIFTKSIEEPERYQAEFCGNVTTFNQTNCNSKKKIPVGNYMVFLDRNGTYDLETNDSFESL